jgi:peptidyl-prolyl cis-trans isomerase C
MRFNRLFLTLAAAAALGCTPAWAQTPPAAPAAGQTPAGQAPAGQADVPADPLVGRVNDEEIHLSDIASAVQGLPDQYKSMPTNTLYPLLLDQLIDREALLIQARKQGLDQDASVHRLMMRAQEQVLEDALMRQKVGPLVTEDAVRARYDRDVANKPGEEEVHARHILVASEADANKIIADLKKGGDFAAIAKARSTDPGAAQGGDLGFFKRGDMLPEFSAVAFALKPGQIADKPVKTQYGWHVIKVEERRASAPPTYAQSHDELRQQIIQESVKKVVADARAGLKIEKFNADGTPVRTTDAAEPPPAPKKP